MWHGNLSHIDVVLSDTGIGLYSYVKFYLKTKHIDDEN